MTAFQDNPLAIPYIANPLPNQVVGIIYLEYSGRSTDKNNGGSWNSLIRPTEGNTTPA